MLESDSPAKGYQPHVEAVYPVLRTPRLAVLVDNVSTNELLGLLGRISATWGGLASTICVPRAEALPGTEWDALIRFFDPDYIYAGSPLGPSSEVLTCRYDPLFFEYDERLYDGSAGPLHGPSITALRTMVQHWTFQAMHRQGANERLTLNNYYVSERWPELQLICAREHGFLSDGEIEALMDCNARGTEVQAFPMDLQEHADLRVRMALFPHLDRDYHDIFSWNTHELMVHTVGDAQGAEQPIVVVGADVADICLWLTLRTLRHKIHARDVFWCPASLLHEGSDPPIATVAHSFLSYLQVSLGRLRKTDSERSAVLISRSLPTDELSVIRSSLIGSAEGWLPLSLAEEPTALLPLRHYSAIEMPEQEYDLMFWQNSSLGTLRIEVPEGISERTEPDVGFLTDLVVDDFSGPTHPAVRPLMTTPWRGEQRPVPHRSGRYRPVANLVDSDWQKGMRLAESVLPIRLQFPDELTLLERYALSRGFSVRPSDSGQTLREIARKFGGIHEAAVRLATGPLRLLADEFMSSTPKRNGKLDDLRAGRIGLRPEAIAEVLQVSVEDAETETRLSEWTRSGVLHYGLGLACPWCHSRDVYLWEQIEYTGVRCSQCRRNFSIAPDLALGWAPVAILDEIVLKGLRADGLEELILARWFSRDHRATRIALGTEWTLPNQTKVEADVIGVVAGDLWIGEARSNDDMKNDKFRRLCHLARELQARQLIFATSRPSWSVAMRNRLRRATLDMADQHAGVAIVAMADLRTDADPKLDVLAD